MYDHGNSRQGSHYCCLDQSKQVGNVISDPFDACVDIEWIFEGA